MPAVSGLAADAADAFFVGIGLDPRAQKIYMKYIFVRFSDELRQ